MLGLRTRKTDFCNVESGVKSYYLDDIDEIVKIFSNACDTWQMECDGDASVESADELADRDADTAHRVTIAGKYAESGASTLVDGSDEVSVWMQIERGSSGPMTSIYVGARNRRAEEIYFDLWRVGYRHRSNWLIDFILITGLFVIPLGAYGLLTHHLEIFQHLFIVWGAMFAVMSYMNRFYPPGSRKSIQLRWHRDVPSYYSRNRDQIVMNLVFFLAGIGCTVLVTLMIH